MAHATVLQTSDFGFTPTKQGKVRDIFDLGDRLLLVATDRLSAFDVVLPDGIPHKGRVLTQISRFWFEKLSSILPSHVISTRLEDFPAPFRDRPDIFDGRSMLVRKTKPLPVECVVRGYLVGSGWNDYVKSGSVCGIQLPPGLREADRLAEPLFTPSTKAEGGAHDENISFDTTIEMLGTSRAREIRDCTLALYKAGAEFAETRGIIIADTKFEFGVDDSGGLVWIDEALTPDSSRFWPRSTYTPGQAQPSFDKQFVRDYLLAIKWNKTPPGPSLPEEVIQTTSQKYLEAQRLLTGESH
jgi:phosphoribosylaminoimidazole-succinocarboxamide synthase